MITQEIIVILNDSHSIKGTVDITGFKSFLDFIEQDQSKYLKINNICWNGSHSDLLILNKNRIIGYI